MGLNREDRLKILDTPGNAQRRLVEPLGLLCEVCGVKRARRVLPGSLTLCCVLRADRCPGDVPPQGTKCFGCGAPATLKIKSGWTCGAHPTNGCPVLAKATGAKVALGNRKHWADPEKREFTLVKHRTTTQAHYGVDNPAQSPKVQARIEAKVMERYGVRNASMSPEIQEKTRQTYQERYGVNHHSQRPEQRRRLINAVIERFGVQSVVASSAWREAFLAKTGVDHPMKLDESKVSQRHAFEARYGGSPNADPGVIARRKATCIKRYGVTHGVTREVILARDATNTLRYGVTNPMFNLDVVRSRWLPRLYRLHHHTLPSGRVIAYQGYELIPLLNYLDVYGEDDVLFNGEVSVPYHHEGRGRVYYPDFLIKSKRLLVEVKSTYTFTKALESTLVSKLSAAVSEGWTPVVEVWTKTHCIARLTYTDVLSLVTP